MNYRRNKYNNIKTIVDGIEFDSKKEAAYYQELKIRQRAGDIIKFDIQVPHILLEAFVDGEGKHERPVVYIADFVVYHDGYTEIVDVKGVQTPIFRLKWKILKHMYRKEPKFYKFTIV